MIACLIEIQKSKFAKIQFHEFEQSEPGCWIKFHVYFHTVGRPVGYLKFLMVNFIIYIKTMLQK